MGVAEAAEDPAEGGSGLHAQTRIGQVDRHFRGLFGQVQGPISASGEIQHACEIIAGHAGGDSGFARQHRQGFTGGFEDAVAAQVV